jgi:hypothetical protein
MSAIFAKKKDTLRGLLSISPGGMVTMPRIPIADHCAILMSSGPDSSALRDFASGAVYLVSSGLMNACEFGSNLGPGI